MVAIKKTEKEKNDMGISRSAQLRDDAEAQIARSSKISHDLEAQTQEKLIHELKVHQIELEMQADELKTISLKLEESRDKYLDLYEFAPLSYLTLTNKMMITDANLTCMNLLGVKRNELINHGFGRFIDPRNIEEWNQYFAKILQSIEKQTCTITLKQSDQRVFPAQLEGLRTIVRGDVITVRIAIIDISDIRNAEETLSQMNKKIKTLYSLTRHDINNHLMGLMGFLYLLEKQSDPATNDYLQKAAAAAQRISDMIQFTKEYEAIGVNAPVWQNCRKLVESAVKQTQLRQITVKNDIPASVEVFTDPLMVKVFFNLMDYALRYGGNITTIRFSIKESGKDQIIVCEDDGQGVPPNEKEWIFDRSFGKNTGVGLILAREILDIVGITIRETGESGKGARFVMEIPNAIYRLRSLANGGQ
jgi:PAS domain S-box-containing protein